MSGSSGDAILHAGGPAAPSLALVDRATATAARKSEQRQQRKQKRQQLAGFQFKSRPAVSISTGGSGSVVLVHRRKTHLAPAGRSGEQQHGESPRHAQERGALSPASLSRRATEPTAGESNELASYASAASVARPAMRFGAGARRANTSRVSPLHGATSPLHSSTGTSFERRAAATAGNQPGVTEAAANHASRDPLLPHQHQLQPQQRVRPSSAWLDELDEQRRLPARVASIIAPAAVNQQRGTGEKDVAAVGEPTVHDALVTATLAAANKNRGIDKTKSHVDDPDYLDGIALQPTNRNLSTIVPRHATVRRKSLAAKLMSELTGEDMDEGEGRATGFRRRRERALRRYLTCRRWLLGTMPGVNNAVREYPILMFVVACLRAIGQIAFANSPLSGAIILAAMFVQGTWFAIMGLLGVVAATGFALIMRVNSPGLYESGLFGYNGVLVALCLIVFNAEGEWDWAIAGPVVVLSCASTFLFISLGNLMVPTLGLPPLTLPFIIPCVAFLSGAVDYTHFPVSLSPAVAVAVGPARDWRALGDYAWDDMLRGLFRGVGQIIFMDEPASGALYVLALFLCSPVSGVFAVLGSAIGMAVGVGVGADTAEIYAGLWGYNAVLTAIAVGGFFFVLTFHSAVLALFTSILAALFGSAATSLLEPVGVPSLTTGFCVATLFAILLQGSVHGVVPVTIATLTVPEDHKSRYTKFVSTLRLLKRSIQRQADGGMTTGRRGTVRANDLKQYRRAFDHLDIHRTGSLSKNDLRGVLRVGGYKLSEEQLARWFEVVDINGDGAISFDEYVLVRDGVFNTTLREKLDGLMQVFDHDFDGFISAADIELALSSLATGSFVLSPEEITVLFGGDKDLAQVGDDVTSIIRRVLVRDVARSEALFVDWQQPQNDETAVPVHEEGSRSI